MTKTFRSSLFALAALCISFCCTAQKTEVFNVKEVTRIENFLASDEMRGRKAGSLEIDKAAAFIADEFKKAGF